MKTCTKCGETKPLDQFFKSGGSRPGYRGPCKACYAATAKSYRERNSEQIKKHRAEYLKANREKYLAACKNYRELNREACIARSIASQGKRREYYREYNKRHRLENADAYRENSKKWWSSNPGKARQYKSARRAAERQSIPSWADVNAIREIYRQAATMQGMHVDHIVPLISPIVCGLHVAANLQILGASENMSKSNRYWPDMPEEVRQ